MREYAQAFVQGILEEVAKILGRRKSERRAEVDEVAGGRSGYRKPRRLAMTSGAVTLWRPRVRGMEERLESRVLRHFVWRTKRGAPSAVTPEHCASSAVA